LKVEKARKLMKIGLVGLGRMGGAMARRILSSGQGLAVFDRDPGQTAPLEALGAEVAPDLAGLAKGRDVVISMLPSDDVLEGVVNGPGGLAECLSPNSIHMVSGTHGVEAMARVARAHAAADQILVACTVLGRPDRAASGQLGLIPGGPKSAVARLAPVLAVLGATIFDPGEDPLSSVAVKIANNFVLGCAIEAMGEGMALVRSYGVDPNLFYQILTEGLFDCVAYKSYGDVIAKEDWGRVGAAATIGLKDADLAMEAAARTHVPLPSGNVWRDHLISAIGRGEGALDWAVMAREQFRASALES